MRRPSFGPRNSAAVSPDSTPPATRKSPVTASIGITAGPVERAGLDLVSQADEAMYLAKRLGRNRVCTWDLASFEHDLQAIACNGPVYGEEIEVTLRDGTRAPFRVMRVAPYNEGELLLVAATRPSERPARAAATAW